MACENGIFSQCIISNTVHVIQLVLEGPGLGRCSVFCCAVWCGVLRCCVSRVGCLLLECLCQGCFALFRFFARGLLLWLGLVWLLCVLLSCDVSHGSVVMCHISLPLWCLAQCYVLFLNASSVLSIRIL